MSKDIKRLPTRPTMVDPKEGDPFLRKQHFQPEEKVGSERGSGVNKADPKKDMRTDLVVEEPKVNESVVEPPKYKGVKFDVGRVLPEGDILLGAEKSFFESLPNEVKEGDLDVINGGNTNGVYRVGSYGDNEGYQKPRHGEDHKLRQYIPDNFAGREVMSYEMTKLLGCEGLVPPTSYWEPVIRDRSKLPEDANGSIQMSAQNFGERHQNLKNVKIAFTDAGDADTFREQLGKTDNISDMMVFDFIIGNCDRHGFNLFWGDNEWSGNKRAIAYDHGLTFPEHAPDEMGRGVGWHLTMDVMKWIVSSDSGSSGISDSMQKSILMFNDGAFKTLAKQHGLNDAAQAGVLHRIQSIKEHMAQKHEDLKSWWSPEDFNSMDEYRGYIKDRLKITPYDIAKIAEERYNTVIL